VIPNTLDFALLEELTPQRRRTRKLRIGWAGAKQHVGDLSFILEVIKATYKEVDWVFFGMMPEGTDPYLAEYHDYVDFTDYYAKLASLDLAIAIAPLEIHPFNEAKSNLRLLEYGILGWPVICTDIFPYKTNNPLVTRLSNQPGQWISAICDRVGESDSLDRECDILREWVKESYLIEQHLDAWMSALTR